MSIPELEILVKYKNKKTKSNIYKINDSKTCCSLFREIFNSDTILWKEEFVMLCLNGNNEVIGFHKVSSGGTTATIVDTKIICQIALLSLAQAVIIAHNHPSGSLEHSKNDIDITRRIKSALDYFEISLLDHLIITDTSYISFADNNILQIR